MANIKSQIKRNRQSVVLREKNKAVRSELRTRTKTAISAVESTAEDAEAKVKAAAGQRVKSDEVVQAAVVRALGRIHALLEPEQRSKLAYLLRTGALSI